MRRQATIPTIKRQRNALLAKVHIAKKDLGLKDEEYRAILEGYGVETSARLNIHYLEDLINYFKFLGWQPSAKNQLKRLREKAKKMAAGLENGDERLRGLIITICGVDDLDWCHDARKLKRLLAVLGRINKEEGA